MSNTRKAEANGDSTATVKWRTHEFTIPRNYDDYPVALTEALEDGKSVAIVRGFLGPAQWAVFKADNPVNRDLADLADEIAKELGFANAGESAASPG